MSTPNINSLLASVKKLNGANYYDWKFDMEMILRRAGWWEVISGKRKKGEISTRATDDWEEKAEDGLTAIGLTIEHDQKAYIRDCNNGVEAWSSLKAIYQKNSRSNRITLKRQFNTFRHDTSKPITDYINGITTLGNQVKAIGVIVVDEDICDVIIYQLAP